MVRHTLKILQQILSDYFETLCIKGLTMMFEKTEAAL